MAHYHLLLIVLHTKTLSSLGLSCSSYCNSLVFQLILIMSFQLMKY